VTTGVAMTDYITTLSNLSSAITGAAGALVGVWLTNRANDHRARTQSKSDLSREQRALVRERGEELYQHADRWQSNLRANSFTWLGVMQGRYSANDALDMEINQNRERKYDFGRIEMLVDVYFPDSRKALDAVMSGRDLRSKLLSNFKNAYKSGEAGDPDFAAGFIESMHDLERVCEDFKKAVVEEIRKM
jgi:hypothetical protein